MSYPVPPAAVFHVSSASLPDLPTVSEGEPEGTVGGGSQFQPVVVP